MKNRFHIMAVAVFVGTLAGCMTDKEVAAPTAIARLNPTQNNKATGTVVFTKVDGGMRVVADIKGLTPGAHGFHIHEKGDCSAPDAASAGGHFNPTGMPHGSHDAAKRHVGDLGNVVADASGKARIDRVDPHLNFEGSTSIINRGVIVHEKGDDLTSQPSGNAGARVACGVIEWQN